MFLVLPSFSASFARTGNEAYLLEGLFSDSPKKPRTDLVILAAGSTVAANMIRYENRDDESGCIISFDDIIYDRSTGELELFRDRLSGNLAYLFSGFFKNDLIHGRLANNSGGSSIELDLRRRQSFPYMHRRSRAAAIKDIEGTYISTTKYKLNISVQQQFCALLHRPSDSVTFQSLFINPSSNLIQLSSRSGNIELKAFLTGQNLEATIISDTTGILEKLTLERAFPW